jgi:hypothetical protein
MGKAMEIGPSKILLTLKEEKFCQLYMTDPKILGNGKQCYKVAYHKKSADHTCSKEATQLIRKPAVKARMREILELSGFNDEHIDNHLKSVIDQNVELGSKVAAIKEYNRLAKRIDDSASVKGTFINVSLNFDKEDKNL